MRLKDVMGYRAKCEILKPRFEAIGLGLDVRDDGAYYHTGVGKVEFYEYTKPRYERLLHGLQQAEYRARALVGSTDTATAAVGYQPYYQASAEDAERPDAELTPTELANKYRRLFTEVLADLETDGWLDLTSDSRLAIYRRSRRVYRYNLDASGYQRFLQYLRCSSRRRECQAKRLAAQGEATK